MTNAGLYGLAEKLVWKAYMDGFMVGSPTEHLVKRLPYAKLPERCKPGRLIMSLPENEREAVKQMTAKHFNHRQS